MNRAVILLAVAALALGSCSGKAKDPAADAKPAADGKAAAAVSKPNPWNSSSAADAAASKLAKAAAAKKPAAKSEAKETANPWAKDPPPGSAPSPDPAAKDQAKK